MLSRTLEILNTDADAAAARVVLFDFDGTLSLIRAGWFDVMVPMMVEELAPLGTGESEADLTEIVEEYVGRLTGRQTIYQMIEYADQIRKRGGTPKDPLEYKHEYLALLMEKIRHRREALREGRVDPDEMMVPGSRRLLDVLRDRGLVLYLASGTDQPFMREEARLLESIPTSKADVRRRFDDYENSLEESWLSAFIPRKRTSRNGIGVSSSDSATFFVETEAVKPLGVSAVGEAERPDEPDCVEMDPVKAVLA